MAAFAFAAGGVAISVRVVDRCAVSTRFSTTFCALTTAAAKRTARLTAITSEIGAYVFVSVRSVMVAPLFRVRATRSDPLPGTVVVAQTKKSTRMFHARSALRDQLIGPLDEPFQCNSYNA
jgi:hypothetical protein